MSFRFCLFLVALLSAGCTENSDQTTAPTSIANAALENPQNAVPQGNGFDFYVLSLSWSPHYCASKGKSGDPQQCGSARPFGFIVHGLWPQYERGYPQYCTLSNKPSREEIRSVSDLTPSAGLVRHEWEKHGSCAGLSPSDYFEVMRVARRGVTIPAQFSKPQRAISLTANQIENAFVQANVGLTTQAIAVDCDRQKLAEVRICLTKSMQFRACPEVDRAGCVTQSMTIEPIK